MVFGRVEEERLQLNESTLYSGGPVRKVINPASPQYLQPVRDALLKNEDYAEANRLVRKMQGYFTESYLPMGDIHILQQSVSNVSCYYW